MITRALAQLHPTFVSLVAGDRRLNSSVCDDRMEEKTRWKNTDPSPRDGCWLDREALTKLATSFTSRRLCFPRLEIALSVGRRLHDNAKRIKKESSRPAPVKIKCFNIFYFEILLFSWTASHCYKSATAWEIFPVALVIKFRSVVTFCFPWKKYRCLNFNRANRLPD